MENVRFNKPLKESEYAEYNIWVDWCNQNGYTIMDNDTEYYCISNPEPTKEDLLQSLRTRRECECFAIINRGKLWYDSLTQTQLSELQTWYQGWLYVTVTKLIPNKPNWVV